jgi:hypothetical protein
MRDFDSYDAAIEAVIEAGFEYIDDSNQNS